MANLELVVDEESVTIRREGIILAALGMGQRGRVEKLILSHGIKQDETMQILQAALVHTLQLKAKELRQQIPAKVIAEQLTGLSLKELEKVLKNENVEVVHGTIKLFEMAIDAALRGKLEKEGIRFKLGDTSSFDKERRVKFVAGEGMFRAWHDLKAPNSGSDLEIVPAFHPVMNRKKQTYLVNGNTDSVVQSDAVRYLHSPYPSLIWGGGWDKVEDPFVLERKEIELTISEKLLGAKGVLELRGVLEALLGIDDTYLAVSGGFEGPYESPGNVRRRAGVSGRARGSEGRCVWAYETLQKRKLLKGAYVPDWFHAEGWPALYKEHGKKG